MKNWNNFKALFSFLALSLSFSCTSNNRTIEINWNEEPLFAGRDIGCIEALGPDQPGCICSIGDEVYLSSGGTWTKMGKGPAKDPFRCFYYSPEQKSYFAGSEKTVYRYDEKSGKWSGLPEKGLPSRGVRVHELRESEDGTLFALVTTDGNSILTLSPGSREWKRIKSAGLPDLAFAVDMAFCEGKLYVAVGRPNFLYADSLRPVWGVYVSEDKGEHFQLISDGAVPVQQLVWDHDKRVLYANSLKGKFSLSIAEGNNLWKPLPKHVGSVLHARDGFLIGFNDTYTDLIVSRDGGKSWAKSSISQFKNIRLKYMAVDSDKTIYMTSDTGCYKGLLQESGVRHDL